LTADGALETGRTVIRDRRPEEAELELFRVDAQMQGEGRSTR
jgi:hypothetical protein